MQYDGLRLRIEDDGDGGYHIWAGPPGSDTDDPLASHTNGIVIGVGTTEPEARVDAILALRASIDRLEYRGDPIEVSHA